MNGAPMEITDCLAPEHRQIISDFSGANGTFILGISTFLAAHLAFNDANAFSPWPGQHRRQPTFLLWMEK